MYDQHTDGNIRDLRSDSVGHIGHVQLLDLRLALVCCYIGAHTPERRPFVCRGAGDLMAYIAVTERWEFHVPSLGA